MVFFRGFKSDQVGEKFQGDVAQSQKEVSTAQNRQVLTTGRNFRSQSVSVAKPGRSYWQGQGSI